MPKRTWTRRHEHGRTTERALIASEIGERQERRQHLVDRQEQRYQEALDRRPERPQEAFMHTFRFAPSVQNVVQAPQRHQPPPITIENTREEEAENVPETPPPSTSTGLGCLVPQTPKRPRPRRSPSPESSPELVLPVSTAPPAIGGSGGRGKQVRKCTTRLVEARRQGFLPNSQDD
ncbi:hypothetical protein CLAIMM_14548 isoform 2 [Cladophialophora immunda]|nr:hypothetical protein CLAIMM_14548 isoform 1 [Cladophialophora immunda]OQV10571.1 hypothetical protein CLAIMM_14548 isoform 2 [Cladophialophora immunda]